MTNKKNLWLIALFAIFIALLACGPTTAPLPSFPTATSPPPGPTATPDPSNSPTIPPPEPSATPTMQPACTPPPCAEDEVYHCEGDCPGGCGTICVTVTPSIVEPTPPDAQSDVYGYLTGQTPAYIASTEIAITALAWSPDGQYLAAGSGNNLVLVDTSTMLPVAAFPVNAPIQKIAFSYDGSYILFIYMGTSEAEVWQIGSNPTMPTAVMQMAGILDADFHPQDNLLAMVNADILIVNDTRGGEEQSAVGDIVFWNVESGTASGAATIPGIEGMVRGVDFSPDGSAIAASGGDSTMVLYNLQNGTAETYTPMGLIAGPVASPKFSDDWNTFIWVSRGTVVVMDFETWTERISLSHEDFIGRSDITADGFRIATASHAGIDGEFLPVVTMWNALDGTKLDVIIGTEGYDRPLAFSPDDAWLAIGDETGNIILWTVP